MIGTKINNYEIVSQIGEGGMGAVYLGRHPVLDRAVAVKVLRDGLARERSLVQRFFNEARAAAAIHHPNIIDVIDVGLLPGSEAPYLMMEFLEGESLAARLRRLGRLPIADATRIAEQTAGALAAAHAKGIVHRDLKPENLFLVPGATGGGEIVKVLDFGIAKLHGELGGEHVHTQTGAIMGTPPYMSPEQCRGISGEIDHRTDVYAVGVILYEMLCGRPPFAGAGFGEVLVMHLTQDPAPPRRHRPEVPEAIEAVVLCALAKAPEQRYTSMLAFGRALSSKATPSAPAPERTQSGSVEVTPLPRGTTTFSSMASELKQVGATGTFRRRGLLAAGGLAVIGVGALALGLQGADEEVPGGEASLPAAVPAPDPPLVPDAGAAAPPVVASRPDAAARPPVDAARRPRRTLPAKAGPEKW